MTWRYAIALACVIAFVTASESAPRRKTAPRAEPKQVVQEQDEYRSCDVAVRDFVLGRREAAALPVKEVRADGLRMTLNFVHPYGESGNTPPNLAFTRGESIDERRKALNEAKQRARVLVEAARTGNVWYVIALNRDNPDGPDARRSPTSVQQEGNRSVASAAVFANIENRCITVYEFTNIAPDTLSSELQALLGARDGVLPQADNPAAAPPSPAATPPS